MAVRGGNRNQNAPHGQKRGERIAVAGTHHAPAVTRQPMRPLNEVVLPRPRQGPLHGPDAASGLDRNRLVRREALAGARVIEGEQKDFINPDPAIRNAA